MAQFARSLETEPDASILTEAIRPLGTIHITLGVMSLASDDRIKAATDLLNSLSSLPPPAFAVSLRGLHAMRQAKWTSSLYAVPKDDEEGTLYSFCGELRERFVKEGFVLPETRPLKLHATVLNTLYAPKVDAKVRARRHESGSDFGDKKVDRGEVVGEGQLEGEQSKTEDGKEPAEAGTVGQKGETKLKSRRRRKKWPLKFDARDLVKKYENFEWVKEARIEKVAICEMGATEVEDEGREERLGLGMEYKEIASIPLP